MIYTIGGGQIKSLKRSRLGAIRRSPFLSAKSLFAYAGEIDATDFLNEFTLYVDDPTCAWSTSQVNNQLIFELNFEDLYQCGGTEPESFGSAVVDDFKVACPTLMTLNYEGEMIGDLIGEDNQHSEILLSEFDTEGGFIDDLWTFLGYTQEEADSCIATESFLYEDGNVISLPQSIVLSPGLLYGIRIFGTPSVRDPFFRYWSSTDCRLKWTLDFDPI